MSHVFMTAVNAVVPILLLILLGSLLRKTGFLTEEFTRIGNKLVFRIGLACSLFVNVYNIPDLASVSWGFILYLVAVTAVLFGLGYVTAVATTKLDTQRGVILQSAFRSNFAIIGLSLATTLGGDEAAAVASLASAFILPLFNILGVIALSLFVKGEGNGKSGKGILKSILKNPMVMGAAAGLFCLMIRELQKAVFGDCVFSIRQHLPFVFTAVNNIKSMTTPLALIILGAQFRFSAVKGMSRQIAVGTVWRIVIAPLIGVFGAVILHSTGLASWGTGEFATALALLGSPAAVSSAVMAGEMGSDEQLATQLVVWSSVGSVLTIFVGVCILMLGGFIV